MKKILEIINLASSAENFIGSQFSYLAKNGGYEMHLICSAGDNLPSLSEKYGVIYKIIPLSRNITPVQDIISLFAICKYIRQNDIDIIICHQAKGNFLGQIAGFIMRVPIRITMSHGILYESMFGLKRWIFILQEKFISSLATNVICVSKFVRLTRLRDGVDKCSKSIVLGYGSCNGIDLNEMFNPYLFGNDAKYEMRKHFGLSESDFVVGFCGRLVKDKGIEELVEAHKILVKQNPDKVIKLFVIGEMEIRDAISENIANYLKNSKDVIFTGYIPHSDISKYYLPMDVFILPSHRDGLGLTPLEAQAMEVPAIVTDFTGCAETIRNGITGEYTDLNPSKMAEIISHYFDKEKAINHGKHGRDFVYRHFNREVVNKNILEYINALCYSYNE